MKIFIYILLALIMTFALMALENMIGTEQHIVFVSGLGFFMGHISMLNLVKGMG